MDDSYVAGMVDADGSIIISKVRPHGHEVSPSYRLSVQVTNTHKSMLEMLKKKFGGSICNKPLTVGSFFTRKSHYNWSVGSKKAVELLKKIQPYLIVKREQAELGIEFWAARSHMAIGGKHRLTNKEIALREGFYQAMKKLKEA